MTALWVTIGVLGLCCWWLVRQQRKEYTQVDALTALRPLIQQPPRKRPDRLFNFKWRLAQDLERKRTS